MSMPFYVSPEQVMADKAEFARKGIARGKSNLAVEFGSGILLIAENSTGLNKVGEIYDRIAFAGVGKFSEFDQLRKIGVRFADTKGYAYSREDVRGKGLANAYSQVIGEAFTRDPKPLEVEMIIAEVGDPLLVGHEANSIYKVMYDGFISDHHGWAVIGGNEEDVESVLRSEYVEGAPLGDAVQLGRKALERGTGGSASLGAENLEVCVLDQALPVRKFRRLPTDEVRGLLDG